MKIKLSKRIKTLAIAVASIAVFASVLTPSLAFQAKKSPALKAATGEKRNIMYYGDWSVWGGQGNFYPQDIPAEKLTHLNFSFMDFDASGNLIWTDRGASIESGLGLPGVSYGEDNAGIIPSLEQLKARNHNLKLGVSFGGWSKGGDFVAVAKDDVALANYVDNTIKLVEYMDLDFVDIDWEFPGKNRAADLVDNKADEGTPAGSADDKALFNRLLRAVRTGLDQLEVKNDRTYELSIALHGTYGVIDGGVSMDVFDIVDFANLMTYDLAGAYDSFSGHQTALYGNAGNTKYTKEYSINDTVQHLLKAGVSSNKLVVGAGFYTRGWEKIANDGFDPTGRPGLGGTAQRVNTDADLAGSNGAANEVPLVSGDGGRNGGIFGYRNIVKNDNGTYKLMSYDGKNVLYNDLVRHWDDEAKAPYLYNATTGSFFTYDDEQSVAEKAKYVNDQNLGGVISWQQANDKASVVDSKVRDTLTKAIYTGLYGSTPLSDVTRKAKPGNYETEVVLKTAPKTAFDIKISNKETIIETNEVIKDVETKSKTIMNPLLTIEVASGVSLASDDTKIKIEQSGNIVSVDLNEVVKVIKPGENKSVTLTATTTGGSVDAKSIKEIKMSQRVTSEKQSDINKYMRTQSIYGGTSSANSVWGVGKGGVWPKQILAPFVDMGLSVPEAKANYREQGGVPKLAKLAADTGVKHYNLGFINSAIPTGQTAPVVKDGLLSWGFAGFYALSERGSIAEINDWQYNGIKNSVKGLRDSGGDITVSFGGLNQHNFFEATNDVDVLYNTYKEIIEGLGLTRIDLDIEGGAQQGFYDNGANAEAIKRIQTDLGTDLILTLPVADYGLTTNGIQTVEKYLEKGVDIKIVNLMTMCFGASAGAYDAAAIKAVDLAKDQLIASYSKYGTTLSDDEAYAKLGTNPSIGFETIDHPLFTKAMHQKVVTHAIDKKLGMLSYWVMNRDALIESVDNSGVTSQYEFTNVSKQYPGTKVAGEVKVNFDLDGGSTLDPTDNYLLKVGEAYGVLPVLSKKGSTFAGYKIDGLGDLITASSIVKIDTTHTLKAMWTKKEYNITFNANGGSVVASKKVEWDSIAVPSDVPTKAGVAFKEWSYGGVAVKDSDLYKDLVANDDSVTTIELKAEWGNSMTMTFRFGDGVTPDLDKQYAVGVKYGEFPMPTRAGYTFKGWYDRIQGSGAPAIPLNIETIVTDGDAYAYAHWTEELFTVNYDTDGGTAIASDANYAWDSVSLTPKTIPTKAGYVFKQWTCNGTVVDPLNTKYSDLVDPDHPDAITLLAEYLDLVKVTFDPDGGVLVSGELTKEVTHTKKYGVLPVLKKEGFIFDGYVTTTAIPAQINADSIVDTTLDHTLTAMWTHQTYKVKYDSDGGTAIAEKSGVRWEDASMLPGSTPVKAGYVFKEWQFDKAAVTNVTKYKDLAKVDTLMEVQLVAVYDKQVVVSFNYDGGTHATSNIDAVTSKAYGVLPVPTKEGYSFNNYVVEGTADIITKDSIVSININHTLKATWTAKKYTVKYDSDGGDAIAIKNDVLYQDADLLPSSEPKKSGFIFKEWQLNGVSVSKTAKYSELVANDTIDSITLKAIYDKAVTITFDYAGGTHVTTNMSVRENQAYGTLPEPTKAGFTFSGYLIKDTSTVVDKDTIVTKTVDHTLVAQWVAKDYTVTYDCGTGGSVIANKTSVKWDDANLLPTPNPTRTGFTFNGWVLDSNDKVVSAATKCSELTTSDELTIALRALWRKEVTISFDLDGGVGTGDPKVVYTGDPYGKLPVVTKEGSKFSGYKSDGDERILSETDLVKLEANHVLKAQWVANKYTVQYDINGANVALTPPDKNDVLWLDTDLVPTVNPIKTGYRFKEWIVKGKTVAITNTNTYKSLVADDSIKSVTLQAIYDQEYTVTFEDSDGSALSGEIKLIDGQKYGTLPVVSKKGYTFNGFKEKESSANVTSDTTLLKKVNHVLVAQWTAKTFTVNYDSGVGGSSITSKSGVLWEGKDLLPTTTPTRVGYRFKEWRHNHDGVLVDNNTTYASLAIDDTETYINLVAVWSKEITVTFNTKGGTAGTAKPKKVYTQDTYGTLPVTTKKGSTFAGYKVNGTGEFIVDTTVVTLEADHELIAQWTPNQYIVKYDGDNGVAIADRSNVLWDATNLLPSTIPLKEGYLFKEWVIKDTSTSVNNTKTYAQLVGSDDTKKEVTLKATYDKLIVATIDYNHGSGSVASINVINGAAYGELPTATRPGYSFDGYVLEGSGKLVSKDTIVTETAGHTLVAQWIAMTYALNYDSNGGSNVAGIGGLNWETTKLIPTIEPTRDGFTFKEWIETSSGVIVNADTPYSALVANDQVKSVTLKAIWEKLVEVSFDFDGGIGDDTKLQLSTTYKYRTLPTPKKIGYNLLGYHIENQEALITNDSIVEIESDHKLIAKWDARKYAVVYDANGGTTIENKNNVLWFDNDLLPKTDPTRNGYTFVGWEFEALGTLVTSEMNFNALAEDDNVGSLTFNALWRKNPQEAVVNPPLPKAGNRSKALSSNSAVITEKEDKAVTKQDVKKSVDKPLTSKQRGSSNKVAVRKEEKAKFNIIPYIIGGVGILVVLYGVYHFIGKKKEIGE